MVFPRDAAYFLPKGSGTAHNSEVLRGLTILVGVNVALIAAVCRHRRDESLSVHGHVCWDGFTAMRRKPHSLADTRYCLISQNQPSPVGEPERQGEND